MSTRSLHTATPSAEPLDRSREAFRPVKLLVGAYLGLSILTLAAIVALQHDTAIVNDAAWVRGTIVLLASALMFAFTVRAAKGSRKAFFRVRLMSAIMVVAIVVIIALPGTFPLWLKIEQGVCGAILMAVVVLVNSPRLRSLFARR